MCSLSINRSLCVSSPHLMVISLIQQSLRGQKEGRRKYSPERCGFLQALTLRLLTLPTHKSSLSPPIFQTRPQPITCLLSSPPSPLSTAWHSLCSRTPIRAPRPPAVLFLVFTADWIRHESCEAFSPGIQCGLCCSFSLAVSADTLQLLQYSASVFLKKLDLIKFSFDIVLFLAVAFIFSLSVRPPPNM